MHVWGWGEVRGHGGVCGRLWGDENQRKKKARQNSKSTFPTMSQSTVIWGEVKNLRCVERRGRRGGGGGVKEREVESWGGG